jgi:hypothetical protein
MTTISSIRVNPFMFPIFLAIIIFPVIPEGYRIPQTLWKNPR